MVNSEMNLFNVDNVQFYMLDVNKLVGILFFYLFCILLFYGLLRVCFFSCLVVEEFVWLLRVMGVEVKIFNLIGLF